MVSPLFQVFSMERELSTPFNFAQTFAAARAVLFSPNSTTVYKLPSNLMIMPRLMSAVFAIKAVKFFNRLNLNPLPPAHPLKNVADAYPEGGGKFTSKSVPGKYWQATG